MRAMWGRVSSRAAVGLSAAGVPRRFRHVVGCGSNVVDQFLRLRAIPKVGEKGFFSSPTQIIEASVVGGVTLNHLCWAALYGVDTAGLFLQGADSSGQMLRDEMERQGVSTEFVQFSEAYATAESYVLLQDDGERSIVMATGSTSEIDATAARQHFGDAVAKSQIFTTEISQVPLSGVSELLGIARASDNVLSVLDVDVQPSVATNEAGLGSTAQVLDVVKQADVLKPAMHAAREVMELLVPEQRTEVASWSAEELSARMRDAADCRLVALTDGGNGCALATADLALTVPIIREVSVTDATGAGDAFLGGLVAGLYHNGVPKTVDEMLELGQLANATGAACCQALGGLPAESSREVLTGLLDNTAAQAWISRLAKPDVSDSTTSDDTPILAGFDSSMANDCATLAQLPDSISPKSVEHAIAALQGCSGRVLVTGLGKSGIVARRMAVSLASTGTPAHFVHATEWAHGDLGNCSHDDVVIAISHSGKTVECVQAMAHIKARGATVVSICSNAESPMAQNSDVALCYAIPQGMEPVGGAPTTSVVAQEALVNALVVELILRRGFTAKDFKHNHPGGALGATPL